MLTTAIKSILHKFSKNGYKEFHQNIKMKIGLVIFPFVPSHGSILQTFAIYTKLKEMGHSVTIINREKPEPSLYTVIRRSFSNLKNKIIGNYRGPVLYRGNSPEAIMKNLKPFIDSYFGSDVVTVYSKEDSNAYVLSHAFDAFVVGSDQVWRSKYVPDVYHYYLDFLPENSTAKRIAFCPSFGSDDWEYGKEVTEKCKKLLSLFNAVAVREKGGVNLCHKYLNKEVSHLFDPTILFPASVYFDKFVKGWERECDVASIYYLDINSEKTAIVDRICKRLNLKSVYVINRIQDYNAKISDRIAPSLSTWMSGIFNSRFIITDSFHATMFALYFNKPFITVINERRGAARFRSLMEELELKGRFVSTLDAVTNELIQSSFNWVRINKFLELQRTASINFLTKSLQ